MIPTEHLFVVLGYAVVLCPAVLLAVMGLTMLAGRGLGERATARCTEIAVISGLLASMTILVLMLFTGVRQVPIEMASMAVLPEQHFQLKLELVFDRLSVPFVILTFALVGTIGKFANAYLHREPGFRRFFLLYALFLLGMVLSSLAGTIEMLFIGWELVGLSSALLVAFFHERQAPVRNGLRVWTIYRIADAAFLIAATVLHHMTGHGDFLALASRAPWPEQQASLPAGQATIVGVLLLVAASGKSALVPFSGWLPRAMEGPTPSSAVFYGALSVHLGAFLLLRTSSLVEQSALVAVAVVVLGLATALFAATAARVQSDIKSALAFASLTQVGIIVAEIGLGLRYIPLAHIIGHACLRTLQLLRAPSLLHDYHLIENAIGAHVAREPGFPEKYLPGRWRAAWYQFALERGHLDRFLDRFFAVPFRWLFQQCAAWEQRWLMLLSGESRTMPAASQADESKPPLQGAA